MSFPFIFTIVPLLIEQTVYTNKELHTISLYTHLYKNIDLMPINIITILFQLLCEYFLKSVGFKIFTAHLTME